MTPEQIAESLSTLDDERKDRKDRRHALILVWLDGWPNQDPGRRMSWRWCGSPKKAADLIKGLKKRFPEFSWEYKMMTRMEAKKLRLKPFLMMDAKAMLAAQA